MRAPDLAALRVEYEAVGIDPADMADDPLDEFLTWFEGAIEAGVSQSNAFVLATATSDGVPAARAVLLKAIGPDGLTFYTNVDSRKGRELMENPQAAACFVWIELHRQVRIEGRVAPVDDATADEYFLSRPPGSRLAAAASPQSEVIASRAALESRFRRLEEQYPDGDVPRPPHWSGFRILPDVYEFWQGRPNRFHDRVRYRTEEGSWVRERLAP